MSPSQRKVRKYCSMQVSHKILTFILQRTINSSANKSYVIAESELVQHSFACSNDVNRLLEKCTNIYNAGEIQKRRQRPATAKPVGRCEPGKDKGKTNKLI